MDGLLERAFGLIRKFEKTPKTAFFVFCSIVVNEGRVFEFDCVWGLDRAARKCFSPESRIIYFPDQEKSRPPFMSTPAPFTNEESLEAR
jgi:hypothetical protein